VHRPQLNTGCSLFSPLHLSGHCVFDNQDYFPPTEHVSYDYRQKWGYKLHKTDTLGKALYYPLLPELRGSLAFGKVPRPSPFVPMVRVANRRRLLRSGCGMTLTGKSGSTRRKLCPTTTSSTKDWPRTEPRHPRWEAGKQLSAPWHSQQIGFCCREGVRLLGGTK
jgi:hypothetical protein